MSWVGRVLGGKPPSGGGDVPREDQAHIRLDLERLNEVRDGLGNELIRYVCVGDNDSVLLTVKQLTKDIRQKFNTNTWSSTGTWVSGRSDYLLAPASWNPAVLHRYGEALAPVYNDGWPGLTGSDKSPVWFRTLLRIYGEARSAILNPNMQWKSEPSARTREPWTVDQLKSLVGEDERPIVDAAFELGNDWHVRYRENDTPEKMPGFVEHLRTDPGRRVGELRSLSAKGRANALKTLAKHGLVEGPYFEFGFEQAGDSAKGPREAALILLRSAPSETVLQTTRDAWPKLKAAQKVELARVVAALCQQEAEPALRTFLEGENNETVRAELSRLLGARTLDQRGDESRPDGAEGYTALNGEWIAAPPDVELPEDKPVSAVLRKLIDTAFDGWRAEDERYNREQKDQQYFRRRVPAPADATDRYCRMLNPGGQSPEPNSVDARGGGLLNLAGPYAKMIAPIFAHADLTVWHLMRAIVVMRRQGPDHYCQLAFWQNDASKAVRARLKGHGGLRLFADLCTKLGDRRDGSVRFLIKSDYWMPDISEWPQTDVWPLLARHFSLIDEALGLAAPSGNEELSELRALNLLEVFPKTPARYLSALLDRAIGDRKLAREPSRDLLAAAPGLDDLLLPLLKHPKAETRAEAAKWLADRKATRALDELLKAARKEKLPAPKAAMLGAISRLGGDIKEFVSPEALLTEAEAGLKKANVGGLDWFPFDAMPTAHLSDGSLVDPKIVRWWIALAVKLKEPGSNPWFELLLDQLAPADAAKLGRAVLQAWIAYDTVGPTDDEANAYAAKNVDGTLKSYKQWQPDTTYEQIFAMLRRQKLGEYQNSGNDTKGMLGLASRVEGVDAAALVKSYFRDHYPRTAQCKALLCCLAANSSPVAIQYVLIIAKRWRTRGVQDLAGELVTAIAERRGWTADQLADRTVPSGGFDDAGVLALPIGEKTYSARLDANGKIGLFNPDGKSVLGLPASVSEDAAASLKDAKALLSTSRKEVKQVFDLQTARLYEALCVGRDWPPEDWNAYLLQHPLMRLLVQRLIWMGVDDAGNRVAVFRPLDDLSLTDAGDQPVSLDGVTKIRLAHQSNLSAEEAAAWKAHLEDYEVQPLFDQLGRQRIVLTDAQGNESEIADRKGWLIEAFKLRGIATKLGYTRGQAEDGGVFITYEKRFGGLQLAAIVEFTGNSLPEENRLSALVALRFVKIRKGGLDWSNGVPLKAVPPVLLGEAWNDFHAMAAAGTGFDAEWEKKAGW